MIFNFPSIPNVEICKFDLRFKSVMSFEKIAFLYLNLSQHNHSKLCISSVRKLKLNSAVGLMTFIPTLTDQIKSVQLVSSVQKSELILTKPFQQFLMTFYGRYLGVISYYFRVCKFTRSFPKDIQTMNSLSQIALLIVMHIKRTNSLIFAMAIIKQNVNFIYKKICRNVSITDVFTRRKGINAPRYSFTSRL